MVNYDDSDDMLFQCKSGYPSTYQTEIYLAANCHERGLVCEDRGWRKNDTCASKE